MGDLAGEMLVNQHGEADMGVSVALTHMRDMLSLTIERLFYYNPFTMSIWKRIMYWIGLRSDPGPRYFKFSESTLVTLKTLSEHEGRPEDKLAQDLIAAGLSQYYSVDELMEKWETLSPRERDAAALICLGFTNQEIAEHMTVSPETVKTHITNLLRKFQLSSRYELRNLLSEWDFSAWEK